MESRWRGPVSQSEACGNNFSHEKVRGKRPVTKRGSEVTSVLGAVRVCESVCDCASVHTGAPGHTTPGEDHTM